MLHRVLPWLWRLADENQSHLEVPEATRHQLLAALAACPAPDDVQVRVGGGEGGGLHQAAAMQDTFRRVAV
jgi:hypothetical protein